jgi:hypothetical protein
MLNFMAFSRWRSLGMEGLYRTSFREGSNGHRNPCGLQLGALVYFHGHHAELVGIDQEQVAFALFGLGHDRPADRFG